MTIASTPTPPTRLAVALERKTDDRVGEGEPDALPRCSHQGKKNQPFVGHSNGFGQPATVFCAVEQRI
ncbi:MAG: hypothetical protein GY722_19055 [bacterium]|nr:hypothetical protein [bacterium]